VEKVVSLADRFPKVRDQGERGTCVAFASAAWLEYHLYQASPPTTHHSEQFVYWACKETDGRPKQEGTFLRTARQVLKSRGACLEKTWPYNPMPVGPTEGQGPPPEGAEEEARKYVWASSRKMAAGDVDPLRESIDRGNPVVLSVLTFPSWDYPHVEETGEISMPLPGASPDGGHAVCVVGYELRRGIPGGGAFIFRNSWGRKWARRQGRFGDGYGTLFFDYVRLYGLEAFG
jgi:C1A family cysteine protease